MRGELQNQIDSSEKEERVKVLMSLVESAMGDSANSVFLGAQLSKFLKGRLEDNVDFRDLPEAMHRLGFYKSTYRKRRAWRKKRGNGYLIRWGEE